MISSWHWVAAKREVVADDCPIGISVNELALRLPAGVYTTLRTYHHDHLFRFDAHLDRLRESIKGLGFSIELAEDEIRKIMRVAIYQSKIFSDSRLRIQIDLTNAIGDIFVLSEPLTTPTAEEAAQGVYAVTCALHRNNPLVKDSGFIGTAEAYRKQMPPGVNEALMVGEGKGILEGLSSNFFAVRDRIIWTAGQEVLAGITRALVLEVITGLGFEVNYSPYPIDALTHLDEAFITSTSRGVLSLKSLDQVEIGKGNPYAITRQIREGFERRIEKEIKPI